MTDQQDYHENETPIKCGCGRSPSGYCIGLHNMTNEEFQTWIRESQPKETD